MYNECHRLFRYDAETGLLTRKVKVSTNTKVGDVVGCVDGRGHLVVVISRKLYKVHRIAWLMQTGKMPKELIDHINGIKTDNRWCNLREATQSENGRNRGKNLNNTTGFKGVCASGRHKSPYMAKITLNGKQINLGRFLTPKLAHEAYCKASQKYHREFGQV